MSGPVSSVLGFAIAKNPNLNNINYSMIVTMLMIKIGMNPIQDQLVDNANVQGSQSTLEGDGNSMQALLNAMMANAGKSGLSSKFWKDNPAMLKSFYQAYNDEFNSNPENSSSLKAYLPVSVTEKNGKIIVSSGQQIPGGTSPTSTLGTYLNNQLKALGLPQWSGGPLSDVQQYIMNKLQVGLDSYTGSTSASSLSASDLQNIYNASSDPNLTSIVSVYTGIQSTGTGSTSIATLLTKTWSNSVEKSLENDFNSYAKTYYKDINSKKPKEDSFFSTFNNSLGSATTNLQNTTTTMTTTIQNLSSQESSMDSTAQAIITGAMQGESSMVQNMAQAGS